jgi:hypothetical protein
VGKRVRKDKRGKWQSEMKIRKGGLKRLECKVTEETHDELQ